VRRAIVGRIPLASTIGGESELLSNRLQKLVAKGVRKLLLNLADLTQVNSSGVSISVETYVSVKHRGGEPKIAAPRGSRAGGVQRTAPVAFHYP